MQWSWDSLWRGDLGGDAQHWEAWHVTSRDHVLQQLLVAFWIPSANISITRTNLLVPAWAVSHRDYLRGLTQLGL